MRPDWFLDWNQDRVVIIASGPSAIEQPLALAKGTCRVIVINNSWRLAPWADVLYASDPAWWRENDHTGFTGLKVSRSPWPGVNKVELRGSESNYHNDLILDQPGVVGSGGSSGFQALNLALQFNARHIALIGFDACVDRGAHWHGPHGRTDNPNEATAAMWALHLERQASTLSACGISVTVCGASALVSYQKSNLEQWLDRNWPA